MVVECAAGAWNTRQKPQQDAAAKRRSKTSQEPKQPPPITVMPHSTRKSTGSSAARTPGRTPGRATGVAAGAGKGSGAKHGKPGVERADRGLRPARPAPPQRVGPLVSVSSAAVTQAITSTVQGLLYDLIDIELAARGLLRITIDRRPGLVYQGDAGEFITVHDCERVTRQLQYVLEVEGADYARLEVSSPGLDRPLKSEGDYERFIGLEVALTLKLPFEGRKNWRGQLARDADGWHLQVVDGKSEQRFGFSLAEVREARLVPVLNFKGRQSAPLAPASDATTSNE